jgi:hypothetical protein
MTGKFFLVVGAVSRALLAETCHSVTDQLMRDPTINDKPDRNGPVFQNGLVGLCFYGFNKGLIRIFSDSTFTLPANTACKLN